MAEALVLALKSAGAGSIKPTIPLPSRGGTENCPAATTFLRPFVKMSKRDFKIG